MESENLFRGSLFDQVKDPNLLGFDYLVYEERIFSYLNSIKNRSDYSQLLSFSQKIEKIKELEWLNISQGISVRDDLKGKIVVIDFWTYCCINCMHVMPVLHHLENRFKELVVIGVHSSKFSNEKSKSNILDAMKRHLIKHPVVCDTNLEIWNELGVICWPTLLVLDPNGLVIGEFQGEVQANLVPRFIESCFKFYQSSLISSKLNVNQLSLNFNAVLNLQELKFPTKMISHRTMMFLSDSGNNRILGIDMITGNIELTIGNGKCGLVDSDFENSSFNWPQGLAHDSDTNCLYIADTFNDVIRKADLNAKKVSTICGTFNQYKEKLGEYDFIGGKSSLEQEISSPWDLVLIEKDNSKVILIACAGTHQIWLHSFENKLVQGEQRCLSWWKGLKFEWNTLVCVAGNGKERNKNNSYPLQASFAQPSGLTYDLSDNVYIADAESSTIRVLILKDGSVKNVAGGDKLQPDNLFAYGDIDGKGTDAKLQHPLDVKFINKDENKMLIITDSYNHSLKVVDLKTKFCRKIKMNVNNKLNEPNSILYSQNSIWITDTNNHKIKVLHNFNDESDHSLENFEVKFPSNDIKKFTVPTEINLKNQILLQLPNFHINYEAANCWKIIVKTNKKERLENEGTFEELNKKRDLFQLVPITTEIDSIEKIKLELNIVYCIQEKLNNVCKMYKKKLEFSRKQIESYRDKEPNSDLYGSIKLRIE